MPTLETPEGGIFESNAIARYIARLADKGLYGTTAIQAVRAAGEGGEEGSESLGGGGDAGEPPAIIATGTHLSPFAASFTLLSPARPSPPSHRDKWSSGSTSRPMSWTRRS